MNTDSQWYEVTCTHRTNPARTVVRTIKSDCAETAESIVLNRAAEKYGEPLNNWNVKSEECRWMPKPK